MRIPNEVKDGDYSAYIDKLLKQSSANINLPKQQLGLDSNNPKSQNKQAQANHSVHFDKNLSQSVYASLQNGANNKSKPKNNQNTFKQNNKNNQYQSNQRANYSNNNNRTNQAQATFKQNNQSKKNVDTNDSYAKLIQKERIFIIPSIAILILNLALLSNGIIEIGLIGIIFGLAMLLRFVFSLLANKGDRAFITRTRGQILSLYTIALIVILIATDTIFSVANLFMWLLYDLGFI